MGTAPPVSPIREKVISVLSRLRDGTAEWPAPLFRARRSGWTELLEADHQRHKEDRDRNRQRQTPRIVGDDQLELARRVVRVAIVAGFAAEAGDRTQGEFGPQGAIRRIAIRQNAPHAVEPPRPVVYVD